jgi:hypothetical protein
MIGKYLFYAFIIYLLYRFVFEFIIPVSRTVSSVKKTVDQMKEQQGFQAQQTPPPPKQGASKPKPSTTNTNGEYIEFEEVE